MKKGLLDANGDLGLIKGFMQKQKRKSSHLSFKGNDLYCGQI